MNNILNFGLTRGLLVTIDVFMRFKLECHMTWKHSLQLIVYFQYINLIRRKDHYFVCNFFSLRTVGNAGSTLETNRYFTQHLFIHWALGASAREWLVLSNN